MADRPGRPALAPPLADSPDCAPSSPAGAVWLFAVALVTALAATASGQTPSSTYLSDMTATYATIGWGSIGKDVAVMRTPLRLNGVTYAKGIGTHAASDIRYAIDRRCSRFQAVVGVDDYVGRGTVRFQVWADGAMIYDSGTRTGADPGGAGVGGCVRTQRAEAGRDGCR